MELYVGVYVGLSVCVALLARFRGRGAVNWFLSSLLLSPPLSLLFVLSKSNKSTRHARPALKGEVVKPIPTPLFTWPTRESFDFELVGAEYYQAELQHLADNHRGEQLDGMPLTAMLIPEDENRSDNTAVRVDVDGLTVGYLSLVDSKGYHRRMAELKQKVRPTACAALLVVSPSQNSEAGTQFSVKLDIKPFN
jgi:hypothetical protein